MNKIIALFVMFACAAPLFSAHSAVAIKKAEPVASKASAGTEGVTSLVPSVIGLVAGVIEMNRQQNELSAECIPTSAERNFVDNTMKEWAKVGQVTAAQMETALKRSPCGDSSGMCYQTEVSVAQAPGIAPRYNVFRGAGNDDMVWEGFPRTGIGTYCKSGAYQCSGSDSVTASDTYDLFNQIDFGPEDYTPAEATMAARLLNKVETCSTARLNSKKRALWGEFLVNTASGLGQKTNTGAIMEQVGVMSSSGGAGALGSIGSIATQFMNK